MNSDGLGLTNEILCNLSGQYVLIRKNLAKKLVFHGVAILQNLTNPGVSVCNNLKFYGPSNIDKKVQLWETTINLLLVQTDLPSLNCNVEHDYKVLDSSD